MLHQGSNEWRQARCGSVGSSDAPRVVRRTKTGYSADRDSLMAAKVIERLTGVPVDGFKSTAMLQGTEREPEARLLYSILKNVEVEEVGLVEHPYVKGTHASPDGFLLTASGAIDGLIEIKCPMPAAHLDTLITETVAGDYFVQMQWQMACTGAKWCDYVSFNPAFPTAMQLWVRRVARDGRFIDDLESEIARFIRELEGMIAVLKRRYAAAA
jgi:putative phage-type endonuclease